MLESRLVKQKDGTEKYIDGYFLTIEQISKLLENYCDDDFRKIILNNKEYIKNWIEKNEL
jgi:hypothetical protein